MRQSWQNTVKWEMLVAFIYLAVLKISQFGEDLIWRYFWKKVISIFFHLVTTNILIRQFLPNKYSPIIYRFTAYGFYSYRFYSKWFLFLPVLQQMVSILTGFTANGFYSYRFYSKWFLFLPVLQQMVSILTGFTANGFYSYRFYSIWFLFLPVFCCQNAGSIIDTWMVVIQVR